MSEHTDPAPAQRATPERRHKTPTTQPGTIWQRRAAAEEKLARHLREARLLAEKHPAPVGRPQSD